MKNLKTKKSKWTIFLGALSLGNSHGMEESGAPPAGILKEHTVMHSQETSSKDIYKEEYGAPFIVKAADTKENNTKTAKTAPTKQTKNGPAWGKFTSEDLERLLATARPPKEKKVVNVDQIHDVIYFEVKPEKKSEAIPAELTSHKDKAIEGEYEYDSSSSENEPGENAEPSEKTTWTWGQSIPPSSTLVEEIRARRPQPVIRLGLMEDDTFSRPEKTTEASWSKGGEPSAEIIKKYKDLEALGPQRGITKLSSEISEGGTFVWGTGRKPSVELVQEYEDLTALGPQQVITGMSVKNTKI